MSSVEGILLCYWLTILWSVKLLRCTLLDYCDCLAFGKNLEDSLPPPARIVIKCSLWAVMNRDLLFISKLRLNVSFKNWGYQYSAVTWGKEWCLFYFQVIRKRTKTKPNHLKWKMPLYRTKLFCFIKSCSVAWPKSLLNNSVMKTLRISWPLSTIQNNLIIIHVTLWTQQLKYKQIGMDSMSTELENEN